MKIIGRIGLQISVNYLCDEEDLLICHFSLALFWLLVKVDEFEVLLGKFVHYLLEFFNTGELTASKHIFHFVCCNFALCCSDWGSTFSL
jgi:hypothetical protein